MVLGNYNYQSFRATREINSWHRRSLPSRRQDPGKAIRLAQRLLELGSDVNTQKRGHETSHLASHVRLPEMARFLLKHGADVNVRNSEGKFQLQLASGRKGKAMKWLLAEYSTKQA